MFSAQQARSGIPPGRQSVLPTVRGVPCWGAVLVAVVPATVGAVIDAAVSDSLGTAFRILYFIGGVAAVLAVRRRALFTAVTQPPIVAFGVALVTLSALESQPSEGMRSFLINVLLPISKMFPLMAWTFVVVALLGAGRWYLTRGAQEPVATRAAARRSASRPAGHKPSTEKRPTEKSRAPRPAVPTASPESPRRSQPEAREPRPRQAPPPPPPQRQFSPRADGYGRRRPDPAYPTARRADPAPRRDIDDAPQFPRPRYRGASS